MKKRKIARILSTALAISIIAAMAAGCGQNSDPGSGGTGENVSGGEGSYKDTITIAHWEEPTTLDPQA